MKRILLLVLFQSIASSLLANTHSDADAIVGLWLTESDESLVRIQREQTSYVGNIVALRDPVFLHEEATGLTGQPRVDILNKQPELRQRPLLGIQFLWDFIYQDGKWEGGSVYDPKSGKIYQGYLTLQAPNTMKLRGYVLLPVIGRTSIWRRVIACDIVIRDLLTRSNVNDPVCR